MSAPAAKPHALDVTRIEVEDFFYYEAALLDEWRLEEWLTLFVPGARYLVPPAGSNDDVDPATTLFYVADDGMRLTGVERDIAYGDGATAQAREIVAAQIAPVVEPLVSAIPPGTTLRAVFITKSGDAYVDLSREARVGHSGGTVDELLTVYTIVNALTVNLPAVTAVQVLVEGKEVDTLSGHVDLRRPLAKNLAWVQ